MSNNSTPARVRFAPSPTGRTHIGSVRTALYCYLLARQSGGQFILRIEDTDQKRYVAGAEDELKDALRWLGLQWDEGPDVGGPYGPYHQSERKALYQQYAQQLIDSGHAFYCFCSPKRLQQVRQQQQKLKRPPHYDGHCRRLTPEEAAARVAGGESHVVRFKMPKEGKITVYDRLRGKIVVDNSTLDDYIIVKSDGLALYHLAVVVDDRLMKITHVFRGSEWLPTFPLHAHIYRALGWDEPEWVHLSVFLKPSGKGKLSKRDAAELIKDGKSVFATDLRELGYLPEGVINWIVLMGWSYDDHTEFFTLADLVEKFSIDRLNSSGAAVDFKKFDHFNGLHIRNLSTGELAEHVRPFFEAAGFEVDDGLLHKITPLIQERMTTLDEGPTMAGFFFRDTVAAVAQELLPNKMTAAETLPLLQAAIACLNGLPDFAYNTTYPALSALAKELGVKRGQLFQPLRVGVTGQRISTPLFETMEIVGRETVMARLAQAEALVRAATEEERV